MTIRTRLVLGLLAIALILVIPLVIALRALDDMHETTAGLRDRELAASLLLSRIRAGTEELRRAETALLFVHDSAAREQMEMALTALSAMADSLDFYRLDTAARNVRRTAAEVAAAAPREYAAALAGDAATAERISTTELVPAIGRLERWVEAAARSLQVRTNDQVARTAEAIDAARVLGFTLLLAAIALAAAIAVWLTRTISRPARDLEKGMRAISEGDFGHQLGTRLDRPDEFGRLAAGFTLMSRRLVELDRLKAEFVSIASHELKTPINVILGYLALLQEGVYGPVTEKQSEILGTLESQSQTLARLVKQLLDVSRFEAGGGSIEPRPFDPCEFLEELENAFRVLAHQRGVALEVRCLPGLPPTVAWDRDRMSEVVGNLLSNAFKFTERGGRVGLTAEPVDDGTVVLEVRDTGAGIPPEQLPHIFRKFYQADNQSRASSLGTGLGLAITKEIVDAHGGSITCESTPGVGTAFIITLPARVDASSAGRPAALSAAPAER
ncbi:MAG TPA: HAMP domain-containing sensor histidine kinase [Gemmatimonadaceae bacterium]